MIDLFKEATVQQAAQNTLGCVLHFPKSSFPIKEGIITDVQWYDVEDKDPETTEDKQGDALLTAPGNVFLFESMGNVVMLISAISADTRACVRINAVNKVAEAPHLLTRALGINSFHRNDYEGVSVLKKNDLLYITERPEAIGEIESYIPRHSQTTKGLRIQLT